MITYKSYKIDIVKANNPHSPRDNQPLSYMYDTFGIGDRHSYNSIDAIAKRITNDPDLIWLPYYYDGQTLSTVPYKADWTAAGYIFVSRYDLENYHGWRTFTKARLELIYNNLKREIAEMNHYIQGDVYSYVITTKNGGLISMRHNFYMTEDQVLEVAKGHVNEL